MSLMPTPPAPDPARVRRLVLVPAAASDRSDATIRRYRLARRGLDDRAAPISSRAARPGAPGGA
jgi:hypothetical protein